MPSLGLKNIEKISSTLAAALQAVLGDRPLRAKRFLGCCGMNTDQLISNLVEGIAALKEQFSDKDRFSLGIGGYNGADVSTSSATGSDRYSGVVLSLLKNIRGIDVQELLLPAIAREFVRSRRLKAERRAAERSHCVGVLKLWAEAEMLGEQVKKMLQESEEVTRSSSTMVGGKIELFDGLLKWLDQFHDANLSKNLWLQRSDVLKTRIELIEDSLRGLSGGAKSGQDQALLLLATAKQSLKEIELPKVVSESGFSKLQKQQAVSREMSKAVIKYRRVFLTSCATGVKIGEAVINEMVQRTQELSGLLRKHGASLWANYKQYMLEINSKTAGDLLSSDLIQAKIGELLIMLDRQLGLLIGKSGLSIQAGLSVLSTAAIDETIVRITDFLQENAAAFIAQVTPVAVFERGPAVYQPGENDADTVPMLPDGKAVDATEVAEVRVEPSTSMRSDELVAINAEHEVSVADEKAPVTPVPDTGSKEAKETAAAEPPQIRVGFFSSPASGLTAEQNTKLNVFIKQLGAVSQKEKKPFSQDQLELARKFIAGLLQRKVENTSMAIFLLAEKLSVNPKWIADNKLNLELESLLKPAVTEFPNP